MYYSNNLRKSILQRDALDGIEMELGMHSFSSYLIVAIIHWTTSSHARRNACLVSFIFPFIPTFDILLSYSCKWVTRLITFIVC